MPNILGTIGLPFQFIHAITDSFVMIKLFHFIPISIVLYVRYLDHFYYDVG
ncbi:MAG: hypothetical protein ACI85Q_000538 [Salibacteraceae bacterium]|jgi:hypothetical protein